MTRARHGTAQGRRAKPGARVALALAACAGAAGCGGSAPAPERPNVVLIVVDTLRRDHLSCYGYPRATSPAIDRLAADGVRFERATSQAPWTTPSIGSLLTSRLPAELGIRRIDSILPGEAVLLSEMLQAHDYATGAVVSHKFCSARWGFDQGFDSFDDDNALGHDAVTSPDVSARALEFLAAHAGGERPFFLWLHYFDPHFAYLQHAQFPFEGVPGYRGPIESGIPFSALLKLRRELGPDDAAELVRHYDSEISWTDHHIGSVLERLRELGLYDDALIVFTADHGEEFLEHGSVGHGRTLHREVIDVPLIVKHPRGKGPAGRVIGTQVALLDVVPTVLAAAGIAPAVPLHGVPLDLPPPERAIPSATTKAGGLSAVSDLRHKLVEQPGTGARALFDLVRDPGEREDLLAGDRPDRDARAALERLGPELERWSRLGSGAPHAEVELDAREIEELRGLGYTGD